jgi:hypothetical protein
LRRKKRYILIKEIPQGLPADSSKLMYADERGYVLRVSPAVAEILRPRAKLISGSIKKMKLAGKTNRKRWASRLPDGMK